MKTINSNSVVMLALSLIICTLCVNTNIAEAARVVCLEDDGTTVRIRRGAKCTNTGGTRLNVPEIREVTDPSPILCWANVNSDGTLNSFGGNGTTGVDTMKDGSGSYSVTCTGDYPGLSSTDDIATFATAAQSTHSSAITDVTANETTIDLTAFTRNISTGVLQDRDVKVLVVAEISD